MINKLGFGFLRLPKKGEEFDWDTVIQMVDTYMAGGGTFFDTCYTYLKGFSEMGIRYCEPHCPKQIPIPQYIRMYNEICRYPGDDWKILPSYSQMTLQGGKASDCIGCGICETRCPYNLPIRQMLKRAVEAFGK